MTVWVVSEEWCSPTAEQTGDPCVVSVHASEAAAVAAAVQHRKDLDGNERLTIVSGWSMREGRYCASCGDETRHECTYVGEHFCDYCGAELNGHGTCDNDHDDWDVDVHVTEHEVKS